MKVYLIFLFCVGNILAIGQDRVILPAQYVIDLAEVKDAAFVCLSRPNNEYRSSVLTKFSTPGDVLKTVSIQLDSFEMQDIATMEYNKQDELIYLFGKATKDSVQYFIIISLDSDLNFKETTHFPITPFYGSVFKANMYKNHIVICTQIGEMAELKRGTGVYIYNINENTFLEKIIDQYWIKDAKYLANGNLILDAGTHLKQYDSINDIVSDYHFLNKQKVAYLTTSEIDFHDSLEGYYFFSPAGLAQGVHPNIEKTDNYSGVLYKLGNNFGVEKYKRLGLFREYPAATKSLHIFSKESIYTGVTNNSFSLAYWTSTNKYFTISNLNSELEINWEKTIIPNGESKYISLQGIEVMENGTCLAYGKQADNVFYNDKLAGFVMKFDENGDIIPLGEPTSTINLSLFSLKIFPNPSSDQLVVELENSNRQLYFKLFTSSGHQVFSDQRMTAGKNVYKIEHLESGLYYYQIRDDHQVLKTGSVVKN